MATCKILFFLFLALYISCGKCDVFYKRVGDEVSMNCGAPSNSDTEWKFDNVLIFNVKGKTGAKLKGPSHIVLKASTNGENLKVSRLETRDSGNYICSYSGSVKQHNIYVVSVFAKPGPVLVQSSDAELHCDITGNSNTQVQWLRPPNGQKHNEKSQVIKLKSVTSKDAGQWTCQVKDALTLSVTLTVVDLQTTAVNVSEGDDTKLPCSLPQSVSQRVVGGKWKADHLSDVSFPTLKNTENKGLHWNGKDLSKVNFTTEQLSTKFDVTLKNVQHRDAGKFVCTVEFEGGASRSVEMTLTVFGKNSGGQGFNKGKGKTPSIKEILTKNVYGIELWVWIAVGASSVVLIGLIIVTVLVRQRNKRMKERVRKLRSMRQPLTAKDYCRCKRMMTTFTWRISRDYFHKIV
uniref:CD4-2 molecule, tandem duplicate 2 n=1 Tax=Cyprinus carpio carpio TaxID=630221 RepID=A0A8C1EJQ4_CYPCA